MGPIRQLFEQGNLNGCLSHVEYLWAARHSNETFKASDAGDAAWLFDRTQGSTVLQRQLWPKLLGLLSRWAYLAGRASPSGTEGPSGAVPFLQALQRWLAAVLPSNPMPWAVRAPALLLIAVIGSTTPSQDASPGQPAPSPLLLASEMLRSQLQRRRPSADLLYDSPDAVGDLCTAVELVLDRHAVKGDWRMFGSVLMALLATLAGALGDLCSGVAAAAAASAAASTAPPLPSSPPQQQQQHQQQRPSPLCDARLALALTTAAVQEAAAAALAALHASCRQIGSVCARAAVAAASEVTPPGGSVAVAAASAAARASVSAGVADATAGPVAAAVALAAAAEQMRDIASDAAAGAAAAASRARVTADPRVVLSVVATAASGLLEGCILTVRLQPLGRLQETLLRLLQPSWNTLAGVLQAAAAATAAAAANSAASTTRPGAASSRDVMGRTAVAEAAAVAGSCSSCAVEADPGVAVLDMALGYCWSHLRSHAPLSEPLQAAVEGALGAMIPAAAAGLSPAPSALPAGTAVATVAWPPSPGNGGFWHPARGALAVLLFGALGVGRVLQLAAKGAPVDAAVESLEGHRRNPVFADTQLLAKAVVEAVRGAPAAPPKGCSPAAAAALAGAVLYDAVAGARRLHILYGGVADAAAGRALLAALPPAATGSLRELLDRVFVCQVSVLATAYDILAATPAPPLSLASPVPMPSPAPGDVDGGGSPRSGLTPWDLQRGAEVRTPVAVAAAAALGALADLQFCALQLRAHGELVSRLSADAAAAPATALAPLLALLPCYPAFAAMYAGGAGGGGGFEAAPVAASRLAFLLPLASSYVPYVAEPAEAACVVLPYIYLLFKGAPESVVQAAHSTWAALLAGLCEGKEKQRGSGGGGGAAAANAMGRRGGGAADAPGAATASTSGSGRRAAGVALAASMVPYYVERTFQEPCSVSDVEMLEWGLRQVLQSLPEAYPMKAWCAARLARQLSDWVASAAGAHDGKTAALEEPGGGRGGTGGATEGAGGDGGREEGGRVVGGDVSTTGRVPAAAAAAAGSTGGTGSAARLRRLAAVVGGFVAVVDFALLPQALEALGKTLGEMGAVRDAVVILQQLHDSWLACNDYGRKQLLEQWFQRTLVSLGVPAKL